MKSVRREDPTEDFFNSLLRRWSEPLAIAAGNQDHVEERIIPDERVNR